jgi:hypothetical protein
MISRLVKTAYFPSQMAIAKCPGCYDVGACGGGRRGSGVGDLVMRFGPFWSGAATRRYWMAVFLKDFQTADFFNLN